MTGPIAPSSAAWGQAEWRWAGQLDMADAVTQNLSDLKAVHSGAAPRILAFEPAAPVLTLGRRAQTAVGRAELAPTVALATARGWPVLNVDRGGLATLHLPGQLVLLLAVPVAAVQIRQMVRDLLQAASATAAACGSRAELRADSDAGLWLGDAKLASIGLAHRDGVATHGLALNAAIDTAWAGPFTLCGHANAQLASLYPASPGAAAVVAEVGQILRVQLQF